MLALQNRSTVNMNPCRNGIIEKSQIYNDCGQRKDFFVPEAGPNQFGKQVAEEYQQHRRKVERLGVSTANRIQYPNPTYA